MSFFPSTCSLFPSLLLFIYPMSFCSLPLPSPRLASLFFILLHSLSLSLLSSFPPPPVPLPPLSPLDFPYLFLYTLSHYLILPSRFLLSPLSTLYLPFVFLPSIFSLLLYLSPTLFLCLSFSLSSSHSLSFMAHPMSIHEEVKILDFILIQQKVQEKMSASPPDKKG